MVKTHEQRFIDTLELKVNEHLSGLYTACDALEELAKSLDHEKSNYTSIAFMQSYGMKYLCDKIEKLHRDTLEAQKKSTRPTYPRYSLDEHNNKEILIKSNSNGSLTFYIEASTDDLPKTYTDSFK